MKAGLAPIARAEFGGVVATVVVLSWLFLTLDAPAAKAPAKNPTHASFVDEERRLLERMARDGTNTGALYLLADVCHDAGVEGDVRAVVRAETYLRQLLAIEPTNAPATALLGSVYTMKGRDAFWPTTQLKLVREGNEYMDMAVTMAPEDLRTRLTRAFNNAHMPEFLGRGEIVHADLEWLWGKVEATPERFTLHQRQQLSLHWGRRLKRAGRPDDARHVWLAGRDLVPDSPTAKTIGGELSKLR